MPERNHTIFYSTGCSTMHAVLVTICKTAHLVDASAQFHLLTR